MIQIIILVVAIAAFSLWYLGYKTLPMFNDTSSVEPFGSCDGLLVLRLSKESALVPYVRVSGIESIRLTAIPASQSEEEWPLPVGLYMSRVFGISISPASVGASRIRVDMQREGVQFIKELENKETLEDYLRCL